MICYYSTTNGKKPASHEQYLYDVGQIVGAALDIALRSLLRCKFRTFLDDVEEHFCDSLCAKVSDVLLSVFPSVQYDAIVKASEIKDF